MTRVICPSCLMFGEHKGHKVTPIDESFEKLQVRITESITSGFLSPKQINANIFEVKHAGFLCVEEREKLKGEVHRVFQRVRQACDERERELQREIEGAAQKNLDRLAEVEKKWTQKYSESLEILYLLRLLEEKRIGQKELMLGASELYRKLAFLEDKVDYQEVTALSGMEFGLETPGADGGAGLSHEGLVDCLKTFGRFRDSINISFKV